MALTAEQKQQVLNKAMQDEAFRAALQRDATAAIAQELQVHPAAGGHPACAGPHGHGGVPRCCRRIRRTGPAGCP